MKLTISSKSLLKAVQTVGTVINHNHSMPICQNILFEVSYKLKITATDLDTTLSCVLDAYGESSVCLPAKILTDILKALPEQPIEFLRDGNIVILIAKSGKYKIPCTDASEFPASVKLETPSKINLTAEILSEGISKTLFAVSTDDLRPSMTGVLFRLNSHGLTLAATDAHKLSEYKRFDVSSSEEIDFIVNRKSLLVLKNILTSGDLLIEYNAINAKFIFDDLTFTTRLIDGRFPNYESVIPRDNPIKITASKSELITSIKRVGIFSSSKTSEIVLNIFSGNINITTTDPDYSTDAEENVSIDYDGEPIRIGFNHRLITEILNTLQCDNVIIELSQPNRAGLFIQADSLEENESLLLLTMPMMLASK